MKTGVSLVLCARSGQDESEAAAGSGREAGREPAAADGQQEAGAVGEAFQLLLEKGTEKQSGH